MDYQVNNMNIIAVEDAINLSRSIKFNNYSFVYKLYKYIPREKYGTVCEDSLNVDNLYLGID